MNEIQKMILMAEVIGKDATEAQVQRLVEWVIDNIPRTQWKTAALNLIDCGDAYYLISGRCGECGV